MVCNPGFFCDPAYCPFAFIMALNVVAAFWTIRAAFDLNRDLIRRDRRAFAMKGR